MLDADYQEQESRVKGLARNILAAFKDKTAYEYFLRGKYERDAYKVLEEWDKFIDSCRGEDNYCGDRAVMEALAEAGRIDELQSLLEDTYDPYLQIDGGFLLLESTHLERAFEIFADVLEKDSGSYEACVGLAVIHRHRGELIEAAKYMELALALFPHTSDPPPRAAAGQWLRAGVLWSGFPGRPHPRGHEATCPVRLAATSRGYPCCPLRGADRGFHVAAY